MLTCTYKYTQLRTKIFLLSIVIIWNSSLYFTEIAISAILIISNVVAKEERFTILHFPPRRCVNRSENLYSSLLPGTLAAFVITCILVILGWIIYKVNRTIRSRENLYTSNTCIINVPLLDHRDWARQLIQRLSSFMRTLLSFFFSQTLDEQFCFLREILTTQPSTATSFVKQPVMCQGNSVEKYSSNTPIHH